MIVEGLFWRLTIGLTPKKSLNVLESLLLPYILSKMVKNNKIFKMCIILRVVFWEYSFHLKLLRNHASNANMKSYSEIFQNQRWRIQYGGLKFQNITCFAHETRNLGVFGGVNFESGFKLVLYFFSLLQIILMWNNEGIQKQMKIKWS